MKRTRASAWYLGNALVLLFAAGNFFNSLSAQTPDSKGHEFVLGFMENWQGGLLKRSILYLAADEATTGTVEIPGLGFSTTFSATPGTVTTVTLPATTPVIGSDVLENKGVVVTADNEIAVYGLNQAVFTTDAFLGLPTDILGTEHIVMAGKENLSVRLPAVDPTDAPSEFLVVGVEDNTTVTITPSIDTGTRIAGEPYSIALNRLEAYQLQSDETLEDLTGTIVTSDKPVAVFGGGVCSDIPDNTPYCDHLVEQLPPTSTWGTSFLTVPLATRSGGDIFRILASDNATDVSLNGTSTGSLDRGEFLELDLFSDTFYEIETTKPALVVQYSKSGDADSLPGDPFMMIVPPKEQFLDSYTIGTPAATPMRFNNFINAVVPTSDAVDCTIDGSPFLGPLYPIGTSEYSGVQEAVEIGSHVLNCPVPFGVFSYGLATNDSYGYPGGLALPSPVPQSSELVDLEKDFRYAEVCFEEDPGYHAHCPGGTELGDPLPGNPDGSYLVRAVTKRDGRVAGSNPGQYFSVSTVSVSAAYEELWVEEDFTSCMDLNRVNPAKGGGSVALVWVDEEGTAYKVANAKSSQITIGEGVVTAHLSNVPADSVFLMYVKFQLGLQTFAEPISCENLVSIATEPGGTPLSTASARLTVVEKTQP